MTTSSPVPLPAVPPSAEQRVVDRLQHGPASRTDLAAAAGLPATTVTSAVARLLHRGVVHELPRVPDPRAPRRGRPAGLVALAAPRGLVAVLALSRHDVRVALVGLDGRVLASASAPARPFPAGDDDPGSTATDVPAVAAALLAAVRARCAGTGPATSGVVSVPYPLGPDAGLATARGAVPSPRLGVAVPRWARPDVTTAWRRLLGGVPVLAENDAGLAALGEATRGAAAGARGVVLLRAGDGLGAGLVVEGVVVHGGSGFAGEVAHLPVDPAGARCGCGGRGCLIGRPGTRTALAALRDGADDGDARAALEGLGHHLGGWVAGVGGALASEAVVLDAPPGAARDVLLAAVAGRLRTAAPSPVADRLRVVAGTLGADGPLAGAAALAASGYRPSS